MLEDYRVSLEEDNVDGQFNKEIEYVFYARITDFKQLEKANSKVRQEQWEIKVPLAGDNAAKGTIRVRSEKQENEDPQYILTTKIAINEKGDKMEVSIPSTAEQFVQFKFLSNSGMRKDRYSFKAEDGLVWEVDVFLDPKGGYYQWCKIDFEVPDRGIEIPAFPIDFDETIDATDLQRDSAEDKKVQSLYDQYFITKNVYKNDTSTKEEREEVKADPNKVQDEVLND